MCVCRRESFETIQVAEQNNSKCSQQLFHPCVGFKSVVFQSLLSLQRELIFFLKMLFINQFVSFRLVYFSYFPCSGVIGESKVCSQERQWFPLQLVNFQASSQQPQCLMSFYVHLILCYMPVWGPPFCKGHEDTDNIMRKASGIVSLKMSLLQIS